MEHLCTFIRNWAHCFKLFSPLYVDFFPWPHGRLFSCAGIFIHVLLQLFWQVVQIDQVMQQASKIVLFWQIMNNMCFWRVALIALVLNVVMKMMPNCVWHAVFELRTAILVMSHWYFYVDMNVETIWWVFMPAAADVTLKILRAPQQKKQPIYSLRVEKMNWIRDYAGRHC